MLRLSISLFILLFFIQFSVYSQQKLIVHGYIFSEQNEPIEFANIAVKNNAEGTVSDSLGHFSFSTNKPLPIAIQFSCLGYIPQTINLTQINQVTQPIRITLTKGDEQIEEVNIMGQSQQDEFITRIDPNLTNRVPDASGGGIESVIKTQIGVTSNNELSSTYRVRGGNFDENLVYVNDIEIYRPFLVRAGQQEGLSFTNPDMVSSIEFSPGGFNASYGDKMSSTLNIKYKHPNEYSGSVKTSLLGGSAHLEGISKNKKLTHVTGIRYKTNQYLLGSLDTKGDYLPRFLDVQTYLTYQFNEKWSSELIAYLSQNDYIFEPTNRETSFGTMTDVKKLTIYFEGNEKDKFQTGFGALAINFAPSSNHALKLITSAFKTYEEESFDILGEYWIQDVMPKDEGGSNTTDSLADIAIGGFLQHARNELVGNVFNGSIQGIHQLSNHTFSWKQKIQHEYFKDDINEWELRDSADFSIPYSGSAITLSSAYNANLKLRSTRLSGYVMDQFSIYPQKGKFTFNLGLRYNYWDFNSEFLFSPRFNLTYIPEWEKEVHFRFATGYYYQSPFYKELRTEEGILNSDIQAQRSIHYVAGSDIYFLALGRTFKFTTEAYYKSLYNLISYQIDNVRIRYSGLNDADGYSTGIDFKINGEFVDGVESWASLGIMQTEENLYNDFYITTDSENNEQIIHPGFIPRPADQRVNFALFFQDYLPNNPTFKVNMNLLFGTGLPFGPPKSKRYKANYRMPPYRRVDIGFVKDLTNTKINQNNLFKELSIGIDIFNLFNISNTISYYWVTDVNNQQFAIPNYLTTRLINFNLKASF